MNLFVADITQGSVAVSFNNASPFFTADELSLLIAVVLLVLIFIYGSVSTIHLSFAALRRGNLATLMLGLAALLITMFSIISII